MNRLDLRRLRKKCSKISHGRKQNKIEESTEITVDEETVECEETVDSPTEIITEEIAENPEEIIEIIETETEEEIDEIPEIIPDKKPVKKESFIKDYIFLGVLIALLIYNIVSGNSVDWSVKMMLLCVYGMFYVYFGLDDNW